MPRNLMMMFSGSMMIMLFSQAVHQKISFALFTPAVNLLLAFALLICATGALTLWLETHPQSKPEEATVEQRKKTERKNPRSDRG